MERIGEPSITMSETMDCESPSTTRVMTPSRSSMWCEISYLLRHGKEFDNEVWQLQFIIMSYIVGDEVMDNLIDIMYGFQYDIEYDEFLDASDD